MSTETVTVTATATNQEIWEILMDSSNVKVECVEKLTKVLFDAGLKGPDDLEILANLPKVFRPIADCLKDIPSKKFSAEMNVRSVTNKAPFCPVCRDAGLSPEEYTSHHIWSDESRETVICPTLLAHTCEKCGEKGHMPRYCTTTRQVTTTTTTSRKSRFEPVVEKKREEEKPKHCKVCYQAGFGPDVYSSHFTKVDDEILCPTILKNVCHRCGKVGHTPKYCTITVRNELPRKPSRFSSAVSSPPEPAPIPIYQPQPQYRILSRGTPLPSQSNNSIPRAPLPKMSVKEICDRYGDSRYEHEENGFPINFKLWVDDYSPRIPLTKVATGLLLEKVSEILDQARNANSTQERDALLRQAIEIQELIIKY